MLRTGVETPEFIKRSKELSISADQKIEMINDLAANPVTGVSLGSGIRKWRYAPIGQGKSGGYRVIFFFVNQDNKPIYLLTVFGKKEKANLTQNEQNALRQLGKKLMEI